jgi:hypothetical protein
MKQSYLLGIHCLRSRPACRNRRPRSWCSTNPYRHPSANKLTAIEPTAKPRGLRRDPSLSRQP